MTVQRLAPFALLFVATLAAAAEPRPNPAAALATAQREAMASFAALDGEWKGTATIHLPGGAPPMTTRHTERIGPFLGGTVKMIEGRSYMPDGSVAFNALAILSWDPAKRAYNFRSYAQGHAGDYALKPTADGFTWEIPAGPATMRYTAVVKDGTWHEVGERVVEGQAPVRFIELKLRRTGDSDWPAGGAVLAE